MNLGQLTISILKLLLIFYAASCVLLYFFQDYLLFFPQSTPAANRDKLKKVATTINIGELKVRGWLSKSKEEAQGPLIIYYGGNAEEVSHTILDIDRLKNSSLLSINYRGYGDSEGKPSAENLIQDALHIFDYMVEKQGIEPNKIILMGRSLGAGIAVQVASQRQVAEVILITPFDSLANVAKQHYPIFPVNLLLKHKLDSLSLAPQIDRPVLVLLAEKDKIVPNRHSHNLIKHWRGPVTEITIPATGHNSISSTPEYWQAINDFIDKIHQ